MHLALHDDVARLNRAPLAALNPWQRACVSPSKITQHHVNNHLVPLPSIVVLFTAPLPLYGYVDFWTLLNVITRSNQMDLVALDTRDKAQVRLSTTTCQLVVDHLVPCLQLPCVYPGHCADPEILRVISALIDLSDLSLCPWPYSLAWACRTLGPA